MNINARAWEQYAQHRLDTAEHRPEAAPDRMYWAMRADQGPGAEVLGDLRGRTVIEVGCGPGHHLAHLVARHGAIGHGVDIAPGQVERATRLHGHHARITFTSADAVEFLHQMTSKIDVCLSVFGAVGLTSPDAILPVIARQLVRGGLLAFSVRTIRIDHLVVNRQIVPVTQWTRSGSAWKKKLAAHGFSVDSCRALPDRTALIVARITS